MFRDDRDARDEKLRQLEHEAEALRHENDAMRGDLLAMRMQPAFAPAGYRNVYEDDIRTLSPGERAALSHHTLQPFPVWAAVVLHLCTFGMFSLVHFGLLHDRLPRAQANDPSSGKAIGFSFIPYFNFYWVFFNTLRLTDRLNLQLRLRGMRPEVPRGLLLACCIVGVIPYVNMLIGLPILWTMGVVQLQRATNALAAMGPGLPWTEAPPYAPLPFTAGAPLPPAGQAPWLPPGGPGPFLPPGSG